MLEKTDLFLASSYLPFIALNNVVLGIEFGFCLSTRNPGTSK